MGAFELHGKTLFFFKLLTIKGGVKTTVCSNILHVISGCVAQRAAKEDGICYKSFLILCFGRYAIENPF